MSDGAKFPENPNVIYIITHDQGIAAACYAEDGAEASDRMITPNLNGFAEDGARLTRHFGTSPQCSPARGALMTSQHPHINGLVGLTHRGFKYNNPKNTVVHHMKKHGYKTCIIGFQHEYTGDLREIGYEETYPKKNFLKCKSLLPDIDKVFMKAREVNAKGIPMWITIGLKELHHPWRAFMGLKSKFKPEDIELPEYLPDTPEVRRKYAQFYTILKRYDDFLGKVRNLLNKYDLEKNSIIIITTDHGIAIPRAKGTLYDAGVHTLMIWNWKNKIRRGIELPQLLSSIDFAPTLCELCNIPPAPHFTGKSYAHLLLQKRSSSNKGGDDEINEYIFLEYTYHDIYNPMRAIRSTDFKYIRNYTPEISLPDSVPRDIKNTIIYREWRKSYLAEGDNANKRLPEEFYDLRHDPLEQNNLLAPYINEDNEVDETKCSGEYWFKDYKKLKDELNKWLEQTSDPILGGFYPPPSEFKIDNSDEFAQLKMNEK